MAFPASTQALVTAYGQIKGRALDVRNQSVSLRTSSAAGPVSAERIVGYSAFLNRARTELAALASTPGLAAYAQEQENNPGLDIVAEYNAMLAQINATTAWLSANFPEDAGGYKLAFQINVNGALLWRDFDTASLASFRTVLDSLIATIA